MFPKKNGNRLEMNFLKLSTNYRIKLEMILRFNIILWAVANEI